MPMRPLIFPVIFVTLTVCPTQAQVVQKSKTENGQIIQVRTALNHLTLIEIDEPVTEAAAGSPAFRIERRGNKVFIQPLEEGAATNLFIWTTSNKRFNYALVAPGPITELHFAIDQASDPAAKTAAVSKPLPTPLDIGHIVTKTLLDSVPVRYLSQKRSRDRVDILLSDLLKLDLGRVYIRYSVQNNTSRPYKLKMPDVVAMKSPQTVVPLVRLLNTQLSRKETKRIRQSGTLPVEVFYSENNAEEIGAGKSTTGVIGIASPVSPLKGATILQFNFNPDHKQPVSATLVL
jgi:hypothetical protein